MSDYRIPFNRATVVGREYQYIADAVACGHISGDGRFCREVHDLLERLLGVPRVLLTTSCTHALEMAALLLNLRPEDEVIVPSYTFVSTANAFALRGAKIVFADIRPDTLNLDEKRLPDLVNERTKAIVPVHYAGVGCEMEAIMAVAQLHGAAVVEDNAHGLFGSYRGRLLGTFGCLATQSFHETKNFTCGEGGALLVNDPELIERAEIVREKGTDRSRFFRGQVDKYTWRDMGSSYVLSDALAAFLLAQLEQRESIQARRQRLWETYDRQLRLWAAERGIGTPTVPDDCEQAYHLYYLLMPSAAVRQAYMDHLKSRGILAVFHYQALHLSHMGRRFGGTAGSCPVTEDVAERLLRLPFYTTLTESEQTEIVETLMAFDPKACPA